MSLLLRTMGTLSNDINKSRKWFVVGGFAQLLLTSSCWPLPGCIEDFFLSSVDGLEGEEGFLSSALTPAMATFPAEHLVSVVL